MKRAQQILCWLLFQSPDGPVNLGLIVTGLSARCCHGGNNGVPFGHEFLLIYLAPSRTYSNVALGFDCPALAGAFTHDRLQRNG